MKLNEVSVFFGIIAIGFIVVVIDTLTSGKPLITVFCAFIVALCIVVMKIGSDGNA